MREPPIQSSPVRILRPGDVTTEQLGVPLDRRQRVPQIVGCRGQEVVLLALQVLERGDVLEHRDSTRDGALPIVQRGAAHQDWDVAAIGPASAQPLFGPNDLAAQNRPLERHLRATRRRPVRPSRHHRLLVAERDPHAGEVDPQELGRHLVIHQEVAIGGPDDDGLGKPVDDLLQAITLQGTVTGERLGLLSSRGELIFQRLPIGDVDGCARNADDGAIDHDRL